MKFQVGDRVEVTTDRWGNCFTGGRHRPQKGMVGTILAFNDGDGSGHNLGCTVAFGDGYTNGYYLADLTLVKSISSMTDDRDYYESLTALVLPSGIEPESPDSQSGSLPLS